MIGQPAVTRRPRPDRSRLPLRWLALLLAAAAVLGVAGGFLLQRLHAAAAPPALPTFHGQASWAAGSRSAPGFSLRDQTGSLVSLPALRGKPVLLTFLDSRCHAECPIEGRMLGSILSRLPAADRPTLVVLTVNPRGDTPASIRRAMAEWNLAGPWRWHWLNGSRAQLASVWKAYGITIVPESGDIVHSLALYLIDHRGYERTAYLFPFLPSFVQGDLGELAAEAST